MLSRIFGLKHARVATLAEWHADLGWDDLDHDALTAELLQPTDPALREICRIITDMAGEHPTNEERAEMRARTDAALQDGPALLLAEALRRFPYAEALWQRRSGRLNNLRPVLEHATAHAAARLAGGGVALLGVVDCREALETLVKLHHPSTYPDSMRDTLTVNVSRLAARHQDATLTAAFRRLIAAIEAHPRMGEAKQVGAVRGILHATGLPTHLAPGLQAHLRKHESLLAIRRKLGLAAGADLAPLLDAVFDETTPLTDSNAIKAAAYPPFKALLDQGPEALGQHLMALIAIIEGKANLGVTRWSDLQRDGSGEFRSYPVQGNAETGMANLATGMLARKLALNDAEVGRVVRCAGKFPGLQTRHLLNLALKTAAGRRAGATETALRTLAANNTNVAIGCLPDDWKVDIRRALEGESEAQARTLRPFELPTINFKVWCPEGDMLWHFNPLLDVRLYDARHAAWLAETISAADHGLGPTPEEELAAREHFGAPLGAEERARVLASYTARYRERSARIGTYARFLRGLLVAVRPFAETAPEPLRRFGEHCLSLANKTTPPRKWRDEARLLWDAIGEERGQALLVAVIGALGSAPDGAKLAEPVLRGLVYSAAEWEADVVAPLLADFALRKCYQTVPGVGIRDEKLGNACLWTLVQLPGGAGVPYLARLIARVKYPKIRAKIDVALNEAAAQAGVSRAALDEMCVPTHDLDAEGAVTFALGGGQAALTLSGNREVAIRWVTPEGKTVKAPTAAMKDDREALKAVRATAKEIEADLATQIARLQRIFLEDRAWPIDQWRQRYLDHPLLRTLSARLIWWVAEDSTRTSVIAAKGGLHDVAGRVVAPDSDARIRLWHPIEDAPEAVLAWRDRIETLHVVQPFAQVWREIYRLTDAERATDIYSNRWAGHILKQHQAMTLARLNGWTVTHRMWVDAPNDAPWHLTLGTHGLVADYWIEGTGGDNPDVLDSQAYVYVNTDRVMFHRIAETHSGKDSAYGPDRGAAAPLAEVPIVVFSEVMRHCDLLTGVASIASDPQWLDGGSDAEHPSQWRRGAAADYWTRATGAELEEAGKIRREMLQRIVPRLAIAPLCSFDRQWLLVQGKKHLYRIHLGSAAVHVGEQRQHVCIVPASSSTAPDATWLPFQGDRTLSIILSKAVLLAADDKITDPVILRQI